MPTPPHVPYYRLDTFTVPAAGRAEFLGRVAATHAVLRAQPGFVRDAVLERPLAGPSEVDGSGADASVIATLVEWESEQAAAPVAAAVAAAHRAAGFDRAEMFARLGIRADLAAYRPVVL